MNLEWRETLSVGVEKVDNQHKEIFKRLEKLFLACSEGRCKQEVLNLIAFLEQYVVEHFNDEENLQLASHYNMFNTHKAQHDSFKQDLIKLKTEIETDTENKNFVIQINHLLTDWLINHICESDRAFGIFYRNIINSKEKALI